MSEDEEKPLEINQPVLLATQADQDKVDHDKSTEDSNTGNDKDVEQQEPRRWQVQL